jgi:hypothetical protein
MSINLGDFIEKIFDNFKKMTPALLASAMLTGFILFLPESILAKMNLDNLPPLWKILVGLVFLFCVSLILTILVFTVIKYFWSKRQSKIKKMEQKEKVKNLNPRCKQIINEALKSADKTVRLDISSGDTTYLQLNGFLYRPPQVGFLAERPDNKVIEKFVPPPWLIDLYNEEPELFEE